MTRIVVTGGGGFLGSHLVDRLRERGEDPFVARRADYDLTRWDDAERLFADAKPELVFHLAAEVGGIGANRANPGRYWYANLMMGAHVLELARQRSTAKVVLAGTVCDLAHRGHGFAYRPGDFVIFETEHLAQHEHRPLVRAQRLEQHQHRHRHRFGEHDVGGRVALVEQQRFG